MPIGVIRDEKCVEAKNWSIPMQTQKIPSNNGQLATLGGGCFWCLEAVFDQVIGVEKVESGYAGGTVKQPTYREVCSGTTGHAEVVQITFDPQTISFRELLEIFFTVHNPTTLNRQGADIGTQYRSIILYHDEEQRTMAHQVIAEINAAKIWEMPIVTEVVPFTAFYRAEDYHQNYFANNPGQPYCQMVIAPKVVQFRKKFRHRLKE
jgi:peptide-methionine (S)-S-oxide reductase